MSALEKINGKIKSWERWCFEKQPEELAGSQPLCLCFPGSF